MYPSDYGYATSGGSTTDRTTCLNKYLYEWTDYSDCYNNDWLYNGDDEYTLSPGAYSPGAFAIFAITLSGYVKYSAAYYNWPTYPSVYLLSSVKITSGDGSLDNPYILT